MIDTIVRKKLENVKQVPSDVKIYEEEEEEEEN